MDADEVRIKLDSAIAEAEEQKREAARRARALRRLRRSTEAIDGLVDRVRLLQGEGSRR